MICYCLLFLPEYLNWIFMIECCWTGALLFFALLGLSGCFITCYDRRVRNDLAQPCREICLCCCQPGYNSAISTTDVHDINCSHCWIAILLSFFFFLGGGGGSWLEYKSSLIDQMSYHFFKFTCMWRGKCMLELLIVIYLESFMFLPFHRRNEGFNSLFKFWGI
jgi:hypothetical protein